MTIQTAEQAEGYLWCYIQKQNAGPDDTGKRRIGAVACTVTVSVVTASVAVAAAALYCSKSTGEPCEQSPVTQHGGTMSLRLQNRLPRSVRQEAEG